MHHSTPILHLGSAPIEKVIRICYCTYNDMSGPVLVLMTIVIFGVCMCLDTISLIDEVKVINGLIEGEEDLSV